MDIGEVEMIIALPSPRNKLTHLGLVDLAKLRLQQRAHPETSGTFAEYASIRNSCHLVEVIGRNFYCDCKLGIKGKLCTESMALTYDRNPEFPVDPRFSTVIFKRKRPVGRPRNAGLAMSQRWIYLVMWPQVFFCRAEIFKSGFFVQIYSNQSVSCRNIGQVPLRVTKSCEAVYLDQTKPNTMYMDAIFILFLVSLFPGLVGSPGGPAGSLKGPVRSQKDPRRPQHHQLNVEFAQFTLSIGIAIIKVEQDLVYCLARN